MRCPFCGFADDRVLETRELRDGEGIRRRRECLSCKARFSTLEVLQVNYPLIVKKDGRRENFSKEKLQKGLQAACQKRPIPSSQIESLVNHISNWVLTRGEKEISSQLVGQKVMLELKNTDDVAYVRFASVYRSFQDVQEFVSSLDHPDSALHQPGRGLDTGVNTDLVSGMGGGNSPVEANSKSSPSEVTP